MEFAYLQGPSESTVLPTGDELSLPVGQTNSRTSAPAYVQSSLLNDTAQLYNQAPKPSSSDPPLPPAKFAFLDIPKISPLHEQRCFGYIPDHIQPDRREDSHQGDEPTSSDIHFSQGHYERRIAELEIEVGLLKSKLRSQRGCNLVSASRIAALEQHLRLATSDIDFLTSADHNMPDQQFAQRCDIAIANAHICRRFIERTNVENLPTNTYDSSSQSFDVNGSFTQQAYAQHTSLFELPTIWKLVPIGEVMEPEQKQDSSTNRSTYDHNAFKTSIFSQSPIPPTHEPLSPVYRPTSPQYWPHRPVSRSPHHPISSPDYQPTSLTKSHLGTRMRTSMDEFGLKDPTDLESHDSHRSKRMRHDLS